MMTASLSWALSYGFCLCPLYMHVASSRSFSRRQTPGRSCLVLLGLWQTLHKGNYNMLGVLYCLARRLRSGPVGYKQLCKNLRSSITSLGVWYLGSSITSLGDKHFGTCLELRVQGVRRKHITE